MSVVLDPLLYRSIMLPPKNENCQRSKANHASTSIATSMFRFMDLDDLIGQATSYASY